MLIDFIVGARPNFMKLAPIINQLKNFDLNFKFRIIHTGQHYDKNLSSKLIEQLNLPKPDFNLKVGSGSQAEQTAKIMLGYERILKKTPSNMAVVFGDVNSTLACSITAKKNGLKVCHIEAGIRSGDIYMPEEINRIVTDSITDYFFTTSENANRTLINNGVCNKNIFFVGNLMIDTLINNKKNIKKPKIVDKFLDKDKKFILITLHRPSNVDDKKKLNNFLNQINESSTNIIFSAHPRTMKILDKGFINKNKILICKAQPYFEFLWLLENSCAVITDSGGVSEETTILNKPCFTMRDSTERPETVEIGTNILIGSSPEKLKDIFKLIRNEDFKVGKIPKKWDGKTAQRIIKILNKIASNE